MKSRLCVPGLFLIVVLGATIGCSKVQPSGAASSESSGGDSQITNAIQSKLYADPVIQSKQISVDTANGVVTLAGTVATEAERAQASAEAATIPGVKTVLNNITITAAQAAAPRVASPVAASATALRPRAGQPAAKHREPRSRDDYYDAPAAKVAQAAPAAPAPVVSVPAAPVAPPPPPPPPAKVTVEAGTSLAVRLVDEIDSETAQQGQMFKATLESPLAVDGQVVVPEGYDVEGHVVEVQSAGKFEGRSVLALQLDRIQVGSRHYSITTAPYRKQGSSRTKNTVAKVGAGSVIGAIIGGIAGGGKGAGIGAAAGGGIGGGVQAATKGQQIKLPSETVLTFTLQTPVTVTPTTQSRNAARPKLETPAPDQTNSGPPQR